MASQLRSTNGVIGETAVLLYGPLRTFEETSGTLIRRVARDSSHHIFYFGPKDTDNPGTDYAGKLDSFGTFIENPKRYVSQTSRANEDEIQRVYGEYLSAYHLHERPVTDFVVEAEAVLPPEDWLMQLNPYRMFSMLYNIEGAFKLMLDYELANSMQFSKVVLTRPDLAFYSPIVADVRAGEIHIPFGEGVNNLGVPNKGNASVLFYKNVSSGDFIPGGRNIGFNDQIFMLHRSDAEHFLTLAEALPKYLKERVPPSPETIFYLHLVVRAGLTPVAHPEWMYEIYRKGAPLIRNVTDTPEINLVDRRHPAAVKFRRERPIYSFLRDGRRLSKKLLAKLRG